MKYINTGPVYIVLFCFLCFSCAEKKVGNNTTELQDKILIYDFDNASDKGEFDKLKLDETHPNLLDPQTSVSDYSKIMESWANLHNEIAQHLDENNFNWQIDDSEINILHKFYFDPNGKIKSYFFRILNNDVTASKRKEYAGLIFGFTKEYQLPLEREAQYAQCGKTKYISN